MKSAYELAMERLGQSAPARKLTADQKERLADLESLYKSKIAQIELELQDALRAADGAGDYAKADKLRSEFVIDRQRLESEREAKKDRVREGR